MVRKKSISGSEEILREIELIVGRKAPGLRLSRVANQTLKELAVKGVRAGIDYEDIAGVAQVTAHTVRNWRRASEGLRIEKPEAVELKVTPTGESRLPKNACDDLSPNRNKLGFEARANFFAQEGTIKIHLISGVVLEGSVSVLSAKYVSQIVSEMNHAFL